MFTVQIIVRGRFKSFNAKSEDQAMEYVKAQTPSHSVEPIIYNGHNGAFRSLNDNTSIVGHFVITEAKG